jgi:heterodisulfide reductase subunit C
MEIGPYHEPPQFCPACGYWTSFRPQIIVNKVQPEIDSILDGYVKWMCAMCNYWYNTQPVKPFAK